MFRPLAVGAVLQINSYDDYGIPATTNLGRFQYTGQTWLPEVGLYYYKARIYSPTLGRFLQTDPIGYEDGLNWYDYVGGDPVNGRDPTGLAEDDIRVVGGKISYGTGGVDFGLFLGSVFSYGNYGRFDPVDNEIVVVAKPKKDKDMKKMKKQQSRDVKQLSVSDCLLFAGKKNGVNLALDTGGALLALASAEFRVAAAIGGSILGVIGIGTSIANEDATGAGLAFAGKQAANAGGIAKVGSALARGASRFGVVAVAVSSARDLNQAYQDYQRCRAGAGK